MSQFILDILSALKTCSRCSQASCHRSQASCWRSQACHRRFETYHRHFQACRLRSQVYRQRSKTCHWCSHASCRQSQVLPEAPKVLSGAPKCSQTCHNHFHGTRIAVIKDPSYSLGELECPPRVWNSPEIDTSKFTLHILSDTPGGSQWLKYILLMSVLTLSSWNGEMERDDLALYSAMMVELWTTKKWGVKMSMATKLGADMKN